MATGSRDCTVRNWNTSTWECEHTLVGHSDWVRSVAFTPSGNYLASASDDKTIKIRDTSTWQCIQTLTGHSNNVLSVSFSPLGEYLASGSADATIKIWSHDNYEDGIPDIIDAFPDDPAGSIDTDNDGYPDDWNPRMNEDDSTTGLHLDACPGVYGMEMAGQIQSMRFLTVPQQALIQMAMAFKTNGIRV